MLFLPSIFLSQWILATPISASFVSISIHESGTARSSSSSNSKTELNFPSLSMIFFFFFFGETWNWKQNGERRGEDERFDWFISRWFFTRVARSRSFGSQQSYVTVLIKVKFARDIVGRNKMLERSRVDRSTRAWAVCASCIVPISYVNG